MARTTVRIEGLAELQVALRELPKATGKNVLLRVLKARGQPMADTMTSLAPDDPKTHGNDLRSSIGVGTKLSPRQAGIFRSAFKNDRAAAQVFVGPGALPQAHLMEFIGGGAGPVPFVRPAWDAHQAQVLDGIAADLWTEISKAAARLAKRRAKAAAKAAAAAE